MRPTLELLGELAEQTRSLAQVEFALVRAELRERVHRVELLEEIVSLTRGRGHEVGLHIHTEWLHYYPRPLLGDRFGRHMHEFSEDDQCRLIDRGLK